MGYLLEVLIALRNLRRNTRRTAVAVGTVAFGIVAFMLAGGFIHWIFEQMRESTIHSQLGHIQIVRPHYLDKGIADPYSFLLPDLAVAAPIIERMPSYATTAPRIAFSGLVSHGDASVPFVGEGVSPSSEKVVSTRVNIEKGRDLVTDDELSVLLGEGLSKSMGLSVGDQVVLLVTTAKGGPGAVEVKVAGVFSTASKEYDDTALRLPISVARKLLKISGATTWVLTVKQTPATEQGVAYLRANLPVRDYEVVPWFDLADFYNKTVVLFSRQVNVVKVIIAIIIMLTVSNTQIMSVLERTSEIGTSLALGIPRSVVTRGFLIEGSIIGAIGGICGVLLAYVFADIISYIGIPMPAPPGMSHGFLGQILVTPSLALDAFVLSLVSTVLASVFPAWKAGKMNIVDALRQSL